MKRVLLVALITAALLLGLAGTIAAAPPADNPGKGPPEFAKGVFIHYAKGAAPAKSSGSEAEGYIYSGYHWFDRNIPVHYLVNLTGSGGGSTLIDGIEAAFQTWEDDPGSYMDFTYGGTTSTDISSLNDEMDGYNVVGWADLSQYGYQEEVIAVAIFWYQIGNLRLGEVDVAMNTDGYHWWQNPGETWTAGDDPTAYDCDVQNIITHEAGHWLVLDDLYEGYNSGKTMYCQSAEKELQKRSLDATDRYGIRAIYPAKVPGEGPPPGDMYVADVYMGYSKAGPNYFIHTKVTIVDTTNNAAVPEATVYLETTLYGTPVYTGSATTNTDGIATFKLRSRQTGTYTSTVTDVVKDGWTYKPEENVETSDSINVP